MARASSRVSLSSLSSIAWILFSPRSIFTNFSAARQARETIKNDRPTRSALLELFGRDGKCGQKFHCDLHDNLCHDCGGRDFSINVEPFEETFDGLEEVDERIVARTNILDSLAERRSDIVYSTGT